MDISGADRTINQRTGHITDSYEVKSRFSRPEYCIIIDYTYKTYITKEEYKHITVGNKVDYTLYFTKTKLIHLDPSVCKYTLREEK